MPRLTNQKIRKILYYAEGGVNRFLISGAHCQRLLQEKLSRINDYDRAYVEERINCCNKLHQAFGVSDKAVSLSNVPPSRHSLYYYDFLKVMKHFPEEIQFDYAFGDVNWVPEVPTLVKSRPISDDNANGIILKLDSVRHFRPIIDRVSFADKIDQIVWRGAGWQQHRQAFLSQFWNHPLCNVGQVNPPAGNALPEWVKPKMTIAEQLQYKFILSIEGNDVATNLKWIAQSNSLCFMTKPKFETWMLEERLVAGEHYVELRDDYADLPEKIEYYKKHPADAEAIIRNFQAYYALFDNAELEQLIALLVVQKYLRLSGQL